MSENQKMGKKDNGSGESAVAEAIEKQLTDVESLILKRIRLVPKGFPSIALTDFRVSD